MNQSEYETLMMAHDNLQRELSDIKQLMGKDKHELIKSNIALNKRVQKLEDVNSQLKRQAPGVELELLNMELTDALKQNKRYREALEFYADEETYEPSEVQVGAVTKEGYKILKYKYDPIINTDKGKKARQALEGEE